MAAADTKVLISTSSFGREDFGPLAMLKNAGVTIQVNPFGRTLTENEVMGLVRDVDGLIAGTEPLTAKVLAESHRLKVISRVGTGLENVDLETAERLGIVVTNTPQAPVEAVAELALGGILTLLRRVHLMDQALRSGQWDKQMGGLLFGKTVGIVGLGRIGRRLAELLAPFKVKVVAHDIQPDAGWAKARSIKLMDLADLLNSADVVSLHVPKMPAASYLLGHQELSLLKPSAIVVNTARGGLIDEDALARALGTGAIAGAYLDTFGEEPYSGPLTSAPNVLLTPHIGSYARESRISMEQEAVQNLLNVLGMSEDRR